MFSAKRTAEKIKQTFPYTVVAIVNRMVPFLSVSYILVAIVKTWSFSVCFVHSGCHSQRDGLPESGCHGMVLSLFRTLWLQQSTGRSFPVSYTSRHSEQDVCVFSFFFSLPPRPFSFCFIHMSSLRVKRTIFFCFIHLSSKWTGRSFSVCFIHYCYHSQQNNLPLSVAYTMVAIVNRITFLSLFHTLWLP